MNAATTILRMLVTGRVQRAPQDADPADMGTCFGLEMSLEAEAAAQPDVPPQPPAIDSSARAPWWHLAALRKPASA